MNLNINLITVQTKFSSFIKINLIIHIAAIATTTVNIIDVKISIYTSSYLFYTLKIYETREKMEQFEKTRKGVDIYTIILYIYVFYFLFLALSFYITKTAYLFAKYTVLFVSTCLYVFCKTGLNIHEELAKEARLFNCRVVDKTVCARLLL